MFYNQRSICGPKMRDFYTRFSNVAIHCLRAIIHIRFNNDTISYVGKTLINIIRFYLFNYYFQQYTLKSVRARIMDNFTPVRVFKWFFWDAIYTLILIFFNILYIFRFCITQYAVKAYENEEYLYRPRPAAAYSSTFHL